MSEIKYPNGKITTTTKELPKARKARDLTKSKLGIDFESMINDANTYYLSNGIASIYKKPTPIQIVKVDYPARNKAKITEAYYRMPSTTDYNGIYKKMYIDFEAKSCKEKSFSFERIYPHQVEHLKTIRDMGGISFLIIEFSSVQEVYILDTTHLLACYEQADDGGRKSIPYEYFKEHGTKVEYKLNPRIDYLEAVDKVFFK